MKVMSTLKKAALATDVMLVLRENTRGEHTAMEEAVNLPTRLLCMISYRNLLCRFYGFYAALENTINENTWPDISGLPDVSLTKSFWLRNDLLALGMRHKEIFSLPLCQPLPELHSREQVMGCLYVIEGSMLGGQIISRSIKTSLKLDEQSGARFFHGYGAQTGPNWRKFGDAMRALIITDDQQNQTLHTAKETFTAFQNWVGAEVLV